MFLNSLRNRVQSCAKLRLSISMLARNKLNYRKNSLHMGAPISAKFTLQQLQQQQKLQELANIHNINISPNNDTVIGMIKPQGSKAFASREQLKNAKRIVVKLGSAVITRSDNHGVALGRLASIVEQISSLQAEGKEMLLVTSGAVALGKQRLNTEIRMSMSMRATLSNQKLIKAFNEARAAAAVGQSGLMALYEAMFSQYGVNIAQVLVTKPDFYNPIHQINLKQTISELLDFKIVPIINTNDAVVSPNEPDSVYEKQLAPGKKANNIIIHDNDALAAHLAAEVDAELLILMSDVDGVYSKPPGSEDAKLFTTFTPKNVEQNNNEIEFGIKSSVGLGGMKSKVSSAMWVLEKGTSVVICNGNTNNAITSIVNGKKIGTFFTKHDKQSVNVETLAENARKGSRVLQTLHPEQRAEILLNISKSLKQNQSEIFQANNLDLEDAKNNKLSDVLLSRLEITSKKIDDLADGLCTISEKAKTALEKPLNRVQIADQLQLTQITVPIGVLLVIFESRPDSLPQISGLSIASGNGLLLKGGSEAIKTNHILTELIQNELGKFGAADAIALINTRDEIEELLTLDNKIDLVIPRGSNELVKKIKKLSKSIPVLGHSDGICHVYVDSSADVNKAVKIVKDSKCDYPAACNAMETLLIHESHLNNGVFNAICDNLRANDVELFSGPNLKKSLTFGPPEAKKLRTEYSALKCTVEIVPSLESAIEHINKYGSGHTDVIITEDESRSEQFLRAVDSACVFLNCSTRFSDGYRFGLGAEVGISTTRIHARGPVGLEGLLTTKWILKGNSNVVSDFTNGYSQYIHKILPV